MFQMRKSILAVLMVLALAFVAGPAFADDGGADGGLDGGAAAVTAPAAPSIDVDKDPGNVAKQALEKVKNHDWLALAAICVAVLCWLARKYGGKYISAFKGDGGGVLLVLLTAFVGMLANSVAAGVSPDMDLVRASFTVAVVAAGGYGALKKGGVALLRALKWDGAADWLAKILNVPGSEKTA